MHKNTLLTAAVLAALSFGSSANELPSGLTWIDNMNEPLFASDEAKFGGTLRTHMSSFPQTLRSVGSDSNSGLRHYFMDGTPKLAARHPNTGNWIPQLAEAWAYGDDNQTVYFKLNPEAKWSDGEKVDADDYLFMLTYNRSKDIVAPWYNDFFTNKIEDVSKIDDYTIAIKSATKMSQEELMIQINLPSNGLQPRPEHFFANPKKDENGDGIEDNFVRKFNFKAEPTTWAYYMSNVKKGKSVTFKHVGQDWWGYSNRYYKNRYNVEKVRLTVIRDSDIARKHFEKGDLDVFGLVLPSLWHEKADSKPYQQGYIQKFWGYNQTAQGAGGLWMNTSMPLLESRDVRAGIVYASDYDGMLKKVLRGDYLRMPHSMGAGHGGYDRPNNQAPAFDPKKAIRYFEAAGFNKVGADGIRVNDKGQRLSFDITYGYPPHTPRVAYLKEQAKQAGLEFNLNLVDGSSAFKFILEKKHQLAFLHMGGGEIPAYWEYLHSDNAKPQTNNHTFYQNPDMDNLIDQYVVEFDVAKKQQLSHQIQQKVSDEYLIVPGYMVPYTREAHWRWLRVPEKGMTKLTETMFSVTDVANFWIDSDVKTQTKSALKKGESFEPVTIIDDTYKL
ncbi:extracellular solute-binding protein [Vibrio sp. CB1-14]|uniref:Extracellular solute-binding protein n=1 Tax=Vibrio chaetopteri TaxID=3016528 RepID=A0AAU8BMM2_9VIBR